MKIIYRFIPRQLCCEVVNYSRESGLPAPDFKNISEGFMVTVYSSDKLGDKQKMILKFIENDPYLSLSQLSKALKISQTAVENNIKKLKQKGILKRIGPAKGGFWEILNGH